MTDRIVLPAHRETYFTHCLIFRFIDDPESGYSWECNENGEVDESSLSEVGRRNLAACRAGQVEGRAVQCLGVEVWSRYIDHPATLRCDCGRHIALVDWYATSCPHCGREYNGGGQLLAPRSQWGEETGETF